MEKQLLASNGNLDALKSSIAKYFYSGAEKIDYKEIEKNCYKVIKNGKTLDDYVVRTKKNRVYFYLEYAI